MSHQPRRISSDDVDLTQQQMRHEISATLNSLIMRATPCLPCLEPPARWPSQSEARWTWAIAQRHLNSARAGRISSAPDKSGQAGNNLVAGQAGPLDT